MSNIPDRDQRAYAYPIHRYRKEVRRLYGVLDRQLSEGDFIGGTYSIADIASWTWVDQYHSHIGWLADFPQVAAWHARIAARPAVQRGLNIWMPESDNGWSAAGDANQIAQGAARIACAASFAKNVLGGEQLCRSRIQLKTARLRSYRSCSTKQATRNRLMLKSSWVWGASS